MTKPVNEMTTLEIVKALRPCECGHLTTDHNDPRGWCLRMSCPCKKYVEKQ